MPTLIAIPKRAQRAGDSELYLIIQDLVNQMNGQAALRKTGKAILSGGFVRVFDSRVRRDSNISMDYESFSGIVGVLSAPKALRVDRKSFVIQSTSDGDNSTVAYEIVN